MAITVYQCNICKRTTEIRDRSTGVDHINNCTITNQCRGKLFKIDRRELHIIGERTEFVQGLDDWYPRQVFFEYTQRLFQKIWTIQHDLGNNPALQLFITNDNFKTFVEYDQDLVKISYLSSNVLTVEFPTTVVGIAHCISRSTNRKINYIEQTAAKNVNLIQLTTRGNTTSGVIEGDPLAVTGDLSLGINASLTPDISADIVVSGKFYKIGSIETPISLTYTLTPTKTVNSTWVDFNKIRLNQRIYSIRSLTLLPSATTSAQVSALIPDGSGFHLDGFVFTHIPQNNGVGVITGHDLIIKGNQLWKFKSDFKFSFVNPSDGQTGIYTVVTAVLDSGNTRVTLQEDLQISNTQFDFTVKFVANEVVGLFTDAPYIRSSKNYTQIVDFGLLTKDKSIANILFVGGELSVNKPIIKTVSPVIIKIS